MRVIKSVGAVSSALALTVTLAACGGGTGDGSGGEAPEEGTPQRGGTLNMLGSGDVDYMDPNLSYYSIGQLVLRMWNRQLYSNGATPETATEALPDLAEDLPEVSDDGTTYTITLREGAMWDTEPARQVTAEDMIRGVKRTCNPAQPFGGLPDYADLIVGFQEFCDGFAKVEAKPGPIADYINDNEVEGLSVGDDERTVVFGLTRPAAYFTDMLTMNAFSPAPEEYDAYLPASAELAQNTVAIGPYKIESYEPTKNITLVRNPAWEADTDPIRKAYVDRIVIDQTVSQESTQQQLQTGTPGADMEFDNFPPPSQLPQLIASDDPQFSLGETSSSNPYVVFNLRSPNNGDAMSKLEFRQALMHGISRDNIVQSLGGPKVNPPLTRVLPPTLVGGEGSFDPYPNDPGRAEELLSEAGVDSGATLKLLYRNESEGSRKAFATIQQDLEEIGLDVEGVAVPNADFYVKYLQEPDVASRGVWDLAIAGWGADWYGNGALSFFNPLFAGEPAFPPVGSNFGFYDSAETNDLITAAIEAPDESAAAEAWRAVDEQVMADAPFFPITNPQQANYRAAQVKNAQYVPTIQNYDPTNVWLDPAKSGG